MSETEASLYCPKCGGLNPPGAAVCFACDADMQAAAERPPASQNGLGLLKGRYRLRAQIGEGGFGAVYRAEDSQLGNRLVAVKEMRPAGLSPQEAQEATEAFHREAGLLAGLNHPSLPHIYEHFSENGRWYLVMEYIGGQSLEEQLKRAPLNRLPAREALYIAIQLCTVLEYLHGRVPPIIFRDLKPSNVMLTPEGQVYLIDFGIARHFKPGQSKDTMAFGSPGYAAPEQYGKAQTTPRSDVFSLGALLHQMLSGSDPANTPFRFANLSMPLPTGLNALIHRMVDLDEGKRPPSMAAVKRQLEDMAEAWGTPHTGKVTTALASHQTTATLAPATIGSAKTQGAPTIVPLQTKAPPPPKKKGGKRFGRLLIVAGIMVFFWARSCNQPRISTITDTFPVDTPTAALGIEGNVYAVAWSPDGNLIASARSTGVVNVWGASSGTTFLDYTGHSLAVYTLAWSPDGTEIASAGADGTVQVWDALTGTLNRTYRGHTDAVWAVAWSPDGKEIASGGLDGTVQVWNAVTGVTLLRYTGHNGYIYSVAWSPDGKYIASGGRDSSVQVWDAATGKTLYTYRGHTDKIWSVAWSPDGKRIASASDDVTVQVWDALTGDHVFVYHGDKIVVDALAWSPDGKNLATGGYDDLVQEWDAASGTPIKTYAGQGGTIWSVAWSSDGRRIASGSADGTVRVWDAGTGANALTYSGG